MKSNRVLLALFFAIGISVTLAAGPAARFPVNEPTELTITCPGNFNLQCPSTVVYGELQVTGNCPGAVSVTCDPPSDSAFFRGTTMVSCTATDACSNMAHCSFTVTINDTQPPSITCPANLNVITAGGCLNVTYTTPEASDNCFPRPTVNCTPASGTCFAPGTTTVTCTASDASSNVGSCAFTVTVMTCSITCAANITTSTAAGQCGKIVGYPPPVPGPGCGGATCSPPSGSFFAAGATVVTCTTDAGIACSFTITVNDPAPPVINCPSNVTKPLPAGMATGVVDYQPATATDGCGIAQIACLPPPGAVFPAGTTTVICTAKDRSENLATCSFTVTLTPGQLLNIQCPSNIMQEANAGQTSAIVTYPAPAVTGSLPGATVSCVPPSGSIFGLGSTTVTCTALDTAGHRASCDFRVQVAGGVRLIIPGGKSVVELGAQTPVPVNRKSKKAKGPCGLFTIENTSFASLALTLDAINRTGSDVDGQHISNPREAGLYVLSLINGDGSETPFQIGDAATLAAGERANFCLRANLTVPGLVGATTNLSAAQVIPDLIKTQVIFRTTNGTPLILDVTVHVETAVRFINPDDPRRPAVPSFTISGNEFEVTFAVFDPNLDLNRAKYEFFNVGGAPVAEAFEIDLTQSILERHLVRGQSFSVSQRFTGASSHPEVAGVRVTIFDGETSLASPIVAVGARTAGVAGQAQQLAKVELRPAIVLDRPRVARGRSFTQ